MFQAPAAMRLALQCILRSMAAGVSILVRVETGRLTVPALRVPHPKARPGSGVPREALATMVKLKRRQLKGAAAQLRQRAKRLRETTKVQRVFQQGVVHLRKRWRIVAPNHGKVRYLIETRSSSNNSYRTFWCFQFSL